MLVTTTTTTTYLGPGRVQRVRGEHVDILLPEGPSGPAGSRGAYATGRGRRFVIGEFGFTIGVLKGRAG
jgi:hypothetical protein